MTRRPTFLGVAGAFMRRDLAVAAGYRLSLPMKILAPLLALVSFAYLARFVDQGGGLPLGRYQNAGYLGYWLIGLSVGGLFHAMITALGKRVREAQLEGTLEAMLAAPVPVAYVLFGASLVDVLAVILRHSLQLVVGVLLFQVKLGPVNWMSLAIITGLSFTAFASLGLLGASVTMLLRRGDPITYFAGFAAAVIGGVLYPVEVLPSVLRWASYGLPVASSLEGFRLALFANAPPALLVGALIHLGAFILVIGPLGAWLFARSLRRAREDGSLGQY